MPTPPAAVVEPEDVSEVSDQTPRRQDETPTDDPNPIPTPQTPVPAQPTATIPSTLPPQAPIEAAWTLLIYMDGDNNLEGFAINDLAEIAGVAGLSEAVQVVVQLDRAEGEATTPDDWTEARRFASVEGGLAQVEQLGEVNMGDPATLRDFISWGIEQYPAERYGLIMWGHGVGWQGVAYDRSADLKRLSLPELHGAMRAGLDSVGIEKFDVVGFDACLMGQIDVFGTMEGIADFAVASEELVPGGGVNYGSFLTALAANPTVDGRGLAELLV